MNTLQKILTIITVSAFTLVFILLQPIPQPTMYHSFSDTKTVFGIANFYNVISNIGFLIAGIWGLLVTLKDATKDTYSLVICIGFILTGIGSGYYHNSPNNNTLVWDRLPMTIVFTTFFAQVYSWYVHEKQAKIIWKSTMPLGFFSVIYWYYTETKNCGDLRMYGLVQYLPMLLLLIIIAFKYNEKKLLNNHFIAIAMFYCIAKTFENFDTYFHHFFNTIGGHPLKHIAASIAAYFIIDLQKIKKEN